MKGFTIISVYSRYLNRGGEDEVFESEGRLLADHGCRVRLVSEPLRHPESLREKVGLALNALWSRKWHIQFRALLRKINPQIVHVHNFFPTISPSIYYACREVDVPVVQTLHNYRLLCPATTFFRDGRVCEECVDHSLWRSVRYGCYRDSRPATATVALMLAVHRARGTWTQMVDCYIAPSEFVRRKFIAGGLPEGRIAVKPNFVARDPGTREGIGEYALYAGRLSPGKGVRTLLAAWERLHCKIPLHIAGDGPLREELEMRAVQSSLSSVRFLGRLSHEQTLSAIKGARFLVVPSEWFETFGLVIAEAYASGTPVICARLGAMQEIVADGHTGLHFSPGEAEDLGEKVDWAWSHPELMAEYGRAGRREYEAKYTSERNYAMLMEIYEKAIASRARSALEAVRPVSPSRQEI